MCVACWLILAALERDDRVAKFRFNYLGIVEVTVCVFGRHTTVAYPIKEDRNTVYRKRYNNIVRKGCVWCELVVVCSSAQVKGRVRVESQPILIKHIAVKV